MWVWIGRTLFLYHYMPAVYLGFLALAAVLAECWYGGDEMWFEHLAILATIAPALLLGLGMGWGVLALVPHARGAWGVSSCDGREYSGKFVSATFVLGVVILFIYFFPVWTAMPIERAGYYARMWLQGSGNQELDLTMRGQKRGGRFRVASAAIIAMTILLIVFAIAPRARAAQELLHNGDLSKGSGNQPDHWRTEAWINDPSAVTFNWTHPPTAAPANSKSTR